MRTARDTSRPIRSRPDLILGTAQLGSWYGIANRSGMPTAGEAADLLDMARGLGIRWLDTARSYGRSEARIGDHQRGRPVGERFKIATKLSASLLPPGPRPTGVGRRLAHSWRSSCMALGRRRLEIVMVHRASHLAHAAVRTRLTDLRRRGLVGRIGVSVRSVSEATRALSDPLVQHIQLPFNLLDPRWLSPGVQQGLARRPDVSVHARSLFLQGLLLLSDASRWPGIPGVDPVGLMSRLDRLVVQTGRKDRIDLCLAYVRAQPWIDGIVIGAEIPGQLAEIVAHGGRLPLDAEQAALVRTSIGMLPPPLLDPATWPRYRPQASPSASTTRATSASDRPT